MSIVIAAAQDPNFLNLYFHCGAHTIVILQQCLKTTLIVFI